MKELLLLINERDDDKKILDFHEVFRLKNVKKKSIKRFLIIVQIDVICGVWRIKVKSGYSFIGTDIRF
jgi:hypothetical protein